MIHVREATKEDIGEIWALKQRLHADQIKKDPAYGDGITEEDWLQLYADTISSMVDGSSVYYLAMDGDDPVGMARVSLGPFFGFSRSTAKVDGVYVLESYRKGSALARLYQRVEKDVGDAGIKRLQGFVLTENMEVATMWLKRGARISAVFLEKDYGRDEGAEKVQEGGEECCADAGGGEGELPVRPAVPGTQGHHPGDRRQS